LGLKIKIDNERRKVMFKRRHLLNLLLISVFLVSLIGCSSTEATEQPSVESKPPTESTSEKVGTTEEKIRIGYVVHVTGIEFTAIVEDGAQDAAADYGVELVFTGPPATDNAAQIAEFDALLETDLDGIVFIAGDPAVWAEPVQRAKNKGIVVLTADTDAPETDRDAFFGVDAVGLGRTLGEQVRSLIGDTGKIVLGVCVIGPESHVLRERGFRSAFEGTSVEFVGPYETVCDSAQNYSNWQSAYTANQDAAALVGLTAVETASLGRLKEDVGGDFVVASFDPGAEGLRQLMDGYINVTVGQNPYLAGYLPVQAIVKHIREGREINPGINLYPGELILPEDAEGLMERAKGGESQREWYRKFIDENNLRDFGLK